MDSDGPDTGRINSDGPDGLGRALKPPPYLPGRGEQEGYSHNLVLFLFVIVFVFVFVFVYV